MSDEQRTNPGKIAVTRESLGLRVSLPGIWAEGILFREDEAQALHVALNAALPMGQGLSDVLPEAVRRWLGQTLPDADYMKGTNERAEIVAWRARLLGGRLEVAR